MKSWGLNGAAETKRPITRLPAAAGLLALLPALQLLMGCQPPHPAGQLVVANKSSLDSVDPVDVYLLAGTQLLSAVGDPLYAADRQGQLQPRLATALPQFSADGLSARIPLRQGVRFHDGTRFDAEAMVFNLNRFRRLGKLSYLLDDRIASVRSVGPYTIELRLTRPYRALAALLSSITFTPVSPTAYRDYSERSLTGRFVGTGPYRLVSYSPRKQQLLPFADYWGTPAKNAGIHLITLSNSTALFGSLVSGEVDVLISSGLESDQQQALDARVARRELVSGAGPAIEIALMALNSQRSPFNRRDVRQAVALSLDRRLISERVSFGLSEPLRSLVPPPLAGSSPPSWPAYDPKAARALYRQAGFCNGKRLTLPLTFRSNHASDRLFALTWQAQLRRDLGDCVRLEITGVESTSAYRQLAQGVFPMIIYDWIGDYPDPDTYLAPLLGCRRSTGDHCLAGSSVDSGSFWTAPGLQGQLQASESRTGAARQRSLLTVQRMAAKGASFVPLWQVNARAWGQRNLSAPQFDGSGRVILQALELVQP